MGVGLFDIDGDACAIVYLYKTYAQHFHACLNIDRPCALVYGVILRNPDRTYERFENSNAVGLACASGDIVFVHSRGVIHSEANATHSVDESSWMKTICQDGLEMTHIGSMKQQFCI